MIKDTDKLSYNINMLLDFFLLRHPKRIAFGLITGGILSFLAELFSCNLTYSKYFDFNAIPWYAWLFIGLFIMHIPTAFSAFRQKPIGNDPIDQAMELIERGNFSPAEKRLQYRQLVEKVANAAALKQEFQRELKKIEKSLAAEGKTP
jgi:hypothetical protein